jgi:hypothetical protein
MTRTGGYKMVTTVYDSGVINTGLTAVVNDRDTSLTVPYEVTAADAAAATGDYVWEVRNDDDELVRITVPVTVTVANNKTTASYSQGDVSIVEVVTP